MSEKPVIFISHSSKDNELAKLLKQQIETCIEGAEAFASDIDAGENWFDKVMSKLKQADAIIVLITPNSVSHSHWVWFELGYFWARHDDVVNNLGERQKLYYPVYTDNVSLPNPVYDLQIQAASLTRKRDIISFFRNLLKRFGGDSSELAVDEIISLANVYSQPKISNKEINHDNTLNNFSEDDLEEIVYDIVLNDWRKHDEYFDGDHYVSPLFNENLINYQKFEIENELPIGCGKKFLLKVMKRFHYYAKYDGEKVVRFAKTDNDNYSPPPMELDDISF